MKAAIGIDIGGTNVQVALVHETACILKKSVVEVAHYADPKHFTEKLIDIIGELIDGHDHLEIQGIGVGSPGANIRKGIIENASNLPWEKLQIVDKLTGAFGLPVKLTNDANLFAIAEHAFGEARGMADFVVITLGTGVGAGFYCNGKLLQGRDGLAGEFGHVVVDEKGRPCKCGRNGCLERYVSATGVCLTVQELLVTSQMDSRLRDLPVKEITANRAAVFASAGDLLALQAFEYTGRKLGEGLADLVALFNPEAIFLAGGLVNAGDLLFKPTIRSFEDNLLKIYPTDIPIRKTALAPDHAGVIGAAALVWDTNDVNQKTEPII